jgi:hypothetical protein
VSFKLTSSSGSILSDKIHSATVVEEKSTFWINHISDDVTIELQNVDQNLIYDDCGTTKSCFGLPFGCVDSKNCASFGAVIVKDGSYEFEMLSSSKCFMIFQIYQIKTESFSGDAAYIALALSEDNLMGNDSAIECVNENGIVKAYTSFTRAIPNNYGARRSDIVSFISMKFCLTLFKIRNFIRYLFPLGSKHHPT